MPKKINLYCPRCADHIDRPALALDFQELVTCKGCSAVTAAGQLLTDERQTLLDYFAQQTVQATKNGRPSS